MSRDRVRRSPDPALLVWVMFGVVATEVFVTYARLPAKALWRVSGTGLEGGASRAFVFLSYPVGLVAIALLLLALDRLPSPRLRLLAMLGIASCGVELAFVRTSNWDARPVNAFGAAGVAIALALTVAARRSAAAPDRSAAHWLRVGLALAMLVIAIPATAADLGFYLDRVPVLRDLYQTGAIRHEPGVKGAHDAVHHGHHEGMDGVLFVWSALLLWRCLPTFTSRRLKSLFGACLALLLCYGAAEAFGDFWLEQVAKRGWTSWTFDTTYPAATPAWLVLLVVTAAFWAVAVRRDGALASRFAAATLTRWRRSRPPTRTRPPATSRRRSRSSPRASPPATATRRSSARPAPARRRRWPGSSRRSASRRS